MTDFGDSIAHWSMAGQQVFSRDRVRGRDPSSRTTSTARYN